MVNFVEELSIQLASCDSRSYAEASEVGEIKEFSSLKSSRDNTNIHVPAKHVVLNVYKVNVLSVSLKGAQFHVGKVAIDWFIRLVLEGHLFWRY